MSKKIEPIKHKRLYGQVTFCGVALYDPDRIRPQWRHVTCKRCLRSKPKKGATK